MASVTPASARAPRPGRSSRRSDAHGHGQGQTPTTQSSRRILQMPPYQPQVAPFSDDIVEKLRAMPKMAHLYNLSGHLTKAADLLTDNVGMINDRLADARGREAKKLKRKRAVEEGEGGEGDVEGNLDVDGGVDGNAVDVGGEEYTLAAMEEQVKVLTGQMEERMRKLIDAEVRTETLKEGLTRLHRQAEEALIQQQQAAQARRRTRRAAARGSEDEDEDEDGGEEEDGHPALQNPDGGAYMTLKRELKENKARWKEMSLTDRYTKNNTYINFYRVVHETRHAANSKGNGDGDGAEIPALPHPSTWFANHQTGTGDAGEDQDDVAIHSERHSLRCPITLLPFVDPVKSKKCPHSFEKRAIMSMIERSRDRMPVPDGAAAAAAAAAGSGGRRRTVNCVKCPVCTVQLSVFDLEGDVVALRRIRRVEERRRRDEEEGLEVDESEDGDGEGGDGEVAVSQVNEGRRVKRERVEREVSVVPDTQMGVDDEA
ncbi:hypothetical protein AJ79_03752 [Helicocarpus griseus UAMH5409]|uniref:SP-RING-type domain-containing protein n=1 Tax=Helicocarpus griseus UAMH5409 TaxID=1447875 RepID=A0A2B7XWK6_9EURO|nr:hypothetical protein AJ79_03752 [Helicocarpus griseus UAMH5409]